MSGGHLTPIFIYLIFFNSVLSLSRSDFKVKNEIIQLDESNWKEALETFDYLLVYFIPDF